MTMTTRPALRQVPLTSVWPPQRGECYGTMSVGQWDETLAAMADAGFVLLEVVDDDKAPMGFVIVGAYRGTPERN